jgi:membrane protein DedA with SNARE-associated domain
MAALMIDHAAWLLFVWVLGNQAGVPVPVVPSLLVAGALTRGPSLDFTLILGVVVLASLCADLAWYGVGRWRGAKILDTLGRRLPRRRAPMERVTSLLRTHPAAFLLGARFLPELNPVAAGLAGGTGVGLVRYLVYGAASALLWAGAWTGLGYLLGEGLAASPALPAVVGGAVLVAAGTAVVLVSTQPAVERSRPEVASTSPQVVGETANRADARAQRRRWTCGGPR